MKTNHGISLKKSNLAFIDSFDRCSMRCANQNASIQMI